jgi:hypothetical protein
MCHVIRQSQSEAERPSQQSTRPRWIAAVGATLIGGLAVAALVAPSPTTPVVNVTEPPAAAAPVASRVPAVPPASFGGQGSGPVDDGVPSASAGMNRGMGACDHGM